VVNVLRIPDHNVMSPAAMRRRATLVDYNFKEQIIRTRRARSSQHSVSRETLH